MSDSEDIASLRQELAALTLSRVDGFVNTVRARLPGDIRHQLPPMGVNARQQLAVDLHALERLPAAQAEEGRRIWLEVARAELLSPADARRAREAAAAASEPGRDITLGKNFVPERTKVDLRDDMVAIDWVERAAAAAKAVAYIEVPSFFGGARGKASAGTGFLVDPQHILTAYHVVTARDRNREAPPSPADLILQVQEMTVAFDYVKTPGAVESRGTPLGVGALVAKDEALDVALLQLLAPVQLEPVTLWNGGLPHVRDEIGFSVNIIQHPKERPKKLALRNNAVWRVDPERLYYFTDTLAGSSGAPVFNDDWKVVALHTGFETFNNLSYMGRSLAFSNRGTRVPGILSALSEARAQLPLRVEQ